MTPTRADLDDAYANAAHIPGGAGYPARWAAAAAAFRDGLGARARLDQPYGDAPSERFDLFLPQGTAKGTVVFVHGGFWRAFGRADWSHLAAGPVARGWAVAMPSYTLAPAIRISGITAQIARAVTAIASETRGPIALTGHSAGGHLVARLLAPGMLPPADATRLSHVLPISPVADLRPLIGASLNDDLRLDEAEATAESPLLMTDHLPVPVSILAGAAERPVFVADARALAAAWNAPLTLAPDRHHFDVIDALADPDSATVRTLTTPPAFRG